MIFLQGTSLFFIHAPIYAWSFRNYRKHVSVLCRFFPYGVEGMLAGSATVFFAYIGFDFVASTTEEVKLFGHIICFFPG